MENLIIRNVKFEDIETVVDIQIDGWRTAYVGIIDDEYLKSMDKDKRIEKRQKDYDKTGFIVAELDGEIVGFSRYIFSNEATMNIEGVDCELLALYVKSTLKHNGIGKMMFNYVVDEFKKQNKSKMILWCLKDNEPSKKFYTKMGGTVVAEKPIEFGGKTYLEVAFEYDI